MNIRFYSYKDIGNTWKTFGVSYEKVTDLFFYEVVVILFGYTFVIILFT